MGRSSITTSDFAVAVVNMLHRMEGDGLRIAGITSEGCSFQIPGLSWRAPLSIPATDPENSKLTVVPGLCHRLQNSTKERFHKNPRDAKMISTTRLACVDLREPRCRDILQAACPTHCRTMWIYDYPLLKFLLDHEEIAFDLIRHNNANSDKPMYLLHEIFVLLSLSGKMFHLVREMEQDDARLLKVYRTITDFWSSVKHEAEKVCVCIEISPDDHLLNDLDACIRANRNDGELEEENCDLRIDLATYERDLTHHGVRERLRETLKRYRKDKSAETYMMCRSILARRVLGTTDNLFALAYVLTPEGRAIIYYMCNGTDESRYSDLSRS
jgi:hypothetical protein